MTKLKKHIALVISAVMLTTHISYAAEVTRELDVQSRITVRADIMKNAVKEWIDSKTAEIPNSVLTNETAETNFEDPGMELSQENIQDLYEMGYELRDIEEAVKLSEIFEITPYSLLQAKGKTQYIPHEVENISDINSSTYSLNSEVSEVEMQNTPEYEFTTEEKSWDSVVMDLNDGNVVINENQWEFIKLSGIDEYLDESQLSDEEKAALNAANTENIVSTYSSTATNETTTDIYNNYIFPSSINETVQQGGYVNSDDVYINELTGNNYVKETDVSLKGRNGLDLNLTRYYSVTNANNYDASVYVDEGNPTYETHTYYTVCGNPYVTVRYKEAREDGTKQESFTANQVHIAPGRMNYNKTPGFNYGMFVSHHAYAEDLVRLQNGQEPMYLFENQADANACVAYAANGKYDYTIDLMPTDGGYISSIKYDLSTEDLTVQKVVINGNSTFTVEADGNTYYNDIEDSIHSKYFDIGRGWSFDFPYIEKRYNSMDDVTYQYLHMGTNGIWRIDGNELEGYYLNDLQLSGGGGTINGNGVYKILTEKSGKKYYFGNAGQLLCIEDRYGNQILFEHEVYRDGSEKYPLLTGITDTVGRKIDIDYSASNKVIITVTDKNDASNNRVIEYGKENGKLTSVTNAQGYITTYEYTDKQYSTSMISKDLDDCIDKTTYSLLTGISYPTGSKRRIAYGKMTKNCGIEGVMEIPSCTSNITYEFITDEYGNEYMEDRISEACRRDSGGENKSSVYDGYPSFRSINELPQGYKVYANHTLITDTNTDDPGQINYSVYSLSSNKNWLRETTLFEYVDWQDDRDVYYNTLTDYTYNAQELCTSETTKTYNDYYNDKSTYIQTSKEYTYDSAKFGDLLSVKLNGQADRTTSYTYDSTYHIPTKITYKKDAGTTIIENYTLSDDKKSVIEMTATENNATKRKRGFTYDSYGNVTSEKRYSGNNNWNDYVEITYDYNDSRNVDNKLDGVYVNKISVSGVNDIDGNYANSSVNGVISRSYQYDWYGNTVSETDGNGQAYNYTYDKINRLTKATNPDASTTEYTFTVNSNENSVSVKDANGNTLKYMYDRFGNLISETDTTNNVLLSEHMRTKLRWHLTWEDVTYSAQNNKVITQTMYNGLDKPIEENILDKDGNTLYHSYYDYELAADDAMNKTTRIIYGDTDAENVQNIEYTDEYGNLTKSETVYTENGESKSLVTEYTYDYLGNVLTIKEPRATDENWENAYTTAYEYDIAGNVIKETDVNGNSKTYTYDALGNMTASTDEEGNTTTYTYDVLGRLLKESVPFTSAVNSETKYYYDGNGNVIKQVSPEGNISENTYNWQNNVVKSTGYENSTTPLSSQYYYDSMGNLLRVYTGDVNSLVITGLDNVNNTSDDYAVTKYTYDNLNRCISETDALGNSTANVYDTNGNLIQTTDRNGTVLSYTYDALGNLTQKSTSADTAEAYTYTYDRDGNMLTMTGADGTTVYAYDNLNRLISETTPDGAVKTYTYDAAGNRKSFSLTKGTTTALSYTYDKKNRLSAVSDGTTTVANYTYNTDGTLASEVYGGQIAAYQYNLANLPTVMYNKTTDGTTISQYDYVYNRDGNITSRTDKAGDAEVNNTYVYDGLGRLSVENKGANANYYTYDKYGNRVKAQNKLNNELVSEENYTYDKNNRLTELSTTANAEITNELFYYDYNGNQTGTQTLVQTATEESGAVEMSTADISIELYTYDSYNRLTGYSKSGTTSSYSYSNQAQRTTTAGTQNASYTYNGQGQRISKTVNGVTTSHIWDGDNIVTDITGDTATKYIRGLKLIYSDNGTDKSYYTYNTHGDVVQLTDGQGAVINDYQYYAFGTGYGEDNVNDVNPFGYCGEYTDSETGYVYLRNRYYDPNMGRFVTEDPYWNANNMIYGNDLSNIPDYTAIRQSLNLYVYCLNNPIMYIDPTGNIAWEDASEIIKRNADAIKNAGSYYGVNPAIIASCIYTELYRNVNWIDELTDVPGFFADTSIGIGQVKISTAKLLEDSGYIAKTELASINVVGSEFILMWSTPGHGNGEVWANSREEAIAYRLTTESENINYVTAYLSYWQNRWESVYPNIDGDTAILATLFNQGEINSPHANPVPNPFGEYARKEYYYMRELIKAEY